ncbi:MAG: hypothetical protein LIO94_05075, partial [Clostridiales bacterium]|nr:hypothetical protein [Clostridiales bacterium]
MAVISKDKGYAAMKDYWMGCGIQSERILLKATVKDAILASNENSVRRKQISAGASQLNIGKEYAKYQERE